MLVQFNGQKTHNALISSKFQLVRANGLTWCLEFEQVVKSTFLVLNGIGQFFKSPIFFGDHFGTILNQEIFKFLDCFLYLGLRQNGIQNENSFVMVHYNMFLKERKINNISYTLQEN